VNPLAVLTFAVSTAYLPGVVTATQAGRWAVLTAALFLLLRRGHDAIGPAHVMLLALLAWCALGLVWTITPWDTAGEWRELALFAGVFFLATRERDLVPFWKALALGIAASLPFAAAQALGYQPVENIAVGLRPVGLFLSGNVVNEVCAVALVGCVLNRLWLYAVAPVSLLAANPSREGAFALLAGGGVWLWLLAGRNDRILLAALGGLAATCAVASGTLLDGYSVLHLGDRLEIWAVAVQNTTLLGRGLGSFSALFDGWTAIAGHPLNGYEFAHDEPAQYLFELGIGAPLLLGVVAYAFYWRNVDYVPEVAAFAAWFACALVWFPLHEPVAGFIGAALVGHLCGAHDRVRGNAARSRARGIPRTLDARARAAGAV